MSHPHEDTLRTVYDAFGKGDIETVMGLYTDDIEYHVSGRSPVSGIYSGKDEVLGLFGKLMERSGGTSGWKSWISWRTMSMVSF